MISKNLNNLPDHKVIELMRWRHPLNIERMGNTYKKYIAPAETAQSLMLGYQIKAYLEKRIGEPG